MKQHMEIVELAKELQRQKEAKRDFVADTSLVEVDASGGRLAITFPTNGSSESFGINKLAGEQIAGKLGIPRAYFDHLRDNMPDILADHLN